MTDKPYIELPGGARLYPAPDKLQEAVEAVVAAQHVSFHIEMSPSVSQQAKKTADRLLNETLEDLDPPANAKYDDHDLAVLEACRPHKCWPLLQELTDTDKPIGEFRLSQISHHSGSIGKQLGRVTVAAKTWGRSLEHYVTVKGRRGSGNRLYQATPRLQAAMQAYKQDVSLSPGRDS